MVTNSVPIPKIQHFHGINPILQDDSAAPRVTKLAAEELGCRPTGSNPTVLSFFSMGSIPFSQDDSAAPRVTKLAAEELGCRTTGSNPTVLSFFHEINPIFARR